MRDHIDDYNYIIQSCDDTENLTVYVNFILKNLYSNLLLYFDNEILNQIYSKMYFELSLKLDSAIDNGIKREGFECFIREETIGLLNKFMEKIDCFGENYLLGKCNFSAVDKDVIRLFLPYVIINSFDLKIKNKIKEIVMKKYNLTNMDFIKILFKFTRECAKSKVMKEKENILVKKKK